MILHRLRRRLAGATTVLAVLAAATGGLMLSTGSAQAQEVNLEPQEVTSGSLTFTGDPDDYLTEGKTYAYSPETSDRLIVSSNTERNTVRVTAIGAQGDWWSLNLAAPSGQELKPGVYTGATTSPSATTPGLDLYGNRVCYPVTGTFTVATMDFGPQGYVHQLDATFEQHCEGAAPAARGEIHITTPPPPPVLDLGLGVDVDGSVSTLNGRATVHGTVTCNEPVFTRASGIVTQVAHRVLIRNSFYFEVDCTPDAPVPWTVTVAPTGTVPYQKGDAKVEATTTSADPIWGTYVVVNQTAAVHLDKE
jgi:hypothetical protein